MNIQYPHPLGKILLPSVIHVSVAAAYNGAPPVVLTSNGPAPMNTKLGVMLFEVEHQARHARAARTAGGASC